MRLRLSAIICITIDREREKLIQFDGDIYKEREREKAFLLFEKSGISFANSIINSKTVKQTEREKGFWLPEQHWII